MFILPHLGAAWNNVYFQKKTWKYANLWRKKCFFCQFSTNFQGLISKFGFFDQKKNPNWNNTCKSFIKKNDQKTHFFKKFKGEIGGVPGFHPTLKLDVSRRWTKIHFFELSKNVPLSWKKSFFSSFFPFSPAKYFREMWTLVG